MSERPVTVTVRRQPAAVVLTDEVVQVRPSGATAKVVAPEAFKVYDRQPAVEFVQKTPLGEWIINHNLGYRPSVSLFTLGGVEVDATPHHVSLNQVRVTFTPPFAGYAHLV